MIGADRAEQIVLARPRPAKPPRTSAAVELNRANSMVIVIALVVFGTPCMVTMLLIRARRARTSTAAHSQAECAEPLGEAETYTGSHDGPAWSALDDRQLTRLLTDSVPRTITE